MQLRRNIGASDYRKVEITDREYLEETIGGLQNIIAKDFAELGIWSVEVSQDNVEKITEMLSPFSSFLLGRLTTLMDIHKELYGRQRLVPWFKKPENN